MSIKRAVYGGVQRSDNVNVFSVNVVVSFSVNCNNDGKGECVIQGTALQKYLEVYANYLLIFPNEITVEELLHLGVVEKVGPAQAPIAEWKGFTDTVIQVDVLSFKIIFI